MTEEIRNRYQHLINNKAHMLSNKIWFIIEDVIVETERSVRPRIRIKAFDGFDSNHRSKHISMPISFRLFDLKGLFNDETLLEDIKYLLNKILSDSNCNCNTQPYCIICRGLYLIDGCGDSNYRDQLVEKFIL
jgi:hypothetical protein